MRLPQLPLLASRPIRGVGFFISRTGSRWDEHPYGQSPVETLIFWIAARLYLLPRLNQTRPQAILLPVLLLHSFRHLGLMFLAPGATYSGMPPQFAYPAAFGDLLAALLAVAAI